MSGFDYALNLKWILFFNNIALYSFIFCFTLFMFVVCLYSHLMYHVVAPANRCVCASISLDWQWMQDQFYCQIVVRKKQDNLTVYKFILLQILIKGLKAVWSSVFAFYFILRLSLFALLLLVSQCAICIYN